MRSWLRGCATLLLLGWSGQAFAEEWKVLSLQGEASALGSGATTALHVGDVAPRGALLLTEPGAHALLAHGEDALTLSPDAHVRIDSSPEPEVFVRLVEGGLGVVERNGEGKTFQVVTMDVSLAPQGAAFGVYADMTGTMVSVREGVVQATDLATHTTVRLQAGETMRALRNRPATVQPVVGFDPATQAGGDAERAGEAVGALTGSQVDRAPTGALPGGAGKADAKLAEDAADAAHEQRRKSRLGKADPRAVAAAERIERELWQEPDVETEPWSDDFKWTEVEDGEIRLKPISRIVLGLKGAERFEFWTLAALACLLLGGMTHSLLKETGFGAFANGVLVMSAFAAAILVRDLFFRGGANVEMEPFLSMGMMLAAMPALLLSGAFAKQKWRL